MVVTTKPQEVEQSRMQRWGHTASVQWHGFLGFLWNRSEGTVLGRDASSWGRITIFYMCYYSFLAALFAISITIVLSTLDPDVPRFQTRLQGPGLSIQPRQKSKDALNSDIVYKLSDPESYSKYITQMNTFLTDYRNQGDNEKFQDCNDTRVSLEYTKDGPNRDEIFNQACRFDLSALGVCQDAAGQYGYDEGKPCILVKVNRIVNWFPVGYNDLSKAEASTVSKAPSLLEVLQTRNVPYNPLRMYIACYGVSEEDQQNLNGEVGMSGNTTYFPSDSGGLPFKYYPYLGKRRNPNYLSPVVAVQFNGIKFDTEIEVQCKAYARNIVDDERMQVGFYKFMINIES